MLLTLFNITLLFLIIILHTWPIKFTTKWICFVFWIVHTIFSFFRCDQIFAMSNWIWVSWYISWFYFQSTQIFALRTRWSINVIVIDGSSSKRDTTFRYWFLELYFLVTKIDEKLNGSSVTTHSLRLWDDPILENCDHTHAPTLTNHQQHSLNYFII